MRDTHSCHRLLLFPVPVLYRTTVTFQFIVTLRHSRFWIAVVPSTSSTSIPQCEHILFRSEKFNFIPFAASVRPFFYFRFWKIANAIWLLRDKARAPTACCTHTHITNAIFVHCRWSWHFHPFRISYSLWRRSDTRFQRHLQFEKCQMPERHTILFPSYISMFIISLCSLRRTATEKRIDFRTRNMCDVK